MLYVGATLAALYRGWDLDFVAICTYTELTKHLHCNIETHSSDWTERPFADSEPGCSGLFEELCFESCSS